MPDSGESWLERVGEAPFPSTGGRGLDRPYRWCYTPHKGGRFLSPPVTRPERTYARKICYLQDPDGNWLEFLEGAPIFQFA